MAQFRLAIALDARAADAHCNLGNALKRLGRWDESRHAYREAIAVDPQHVSAHWNESMALLLRGDYANGFVAYEWRFSRPASPLKPVGKPLWNGSALPNGTLFLHAEQGVGDMLQFARFLPAAQRLAKNVVLEVQAALVDLFAANFPGVRVVARGGAVPSCDVHLPVMSLARVFHTTLENLPCSVPYLAPPPDRAVAWRVRAAETGRRRIGLVWAGNMKHNNDRYRSVAFAALAPLFELPNIDWYGLQVGTAAVDVRDLSARANWTDLSPHLRDFADTAAAIAALDRVVAVDTAVAHLAGAMGLPVDILLPFAPDWRWLTDRADSPWYPTARLFRQPRPGDWAGAIDALARTFAP
ncbi:MAG: tetratricopeptide repeat protein [Alphaproteobacteria bacterium]